MTPLRRARIRIALTLTHRPFWIEVWAAAELIAWAAYVLLMPFPIGHVASFSALQHLPDANGRLGWPAVLIGAAQMAACLARWPAGRIACGFAASVTWGFAALVGWRHGDPHPGLVLYLGPMGASLFAASWVFHDWLRRRR